MRLTWSGLTLLIALSSIQGFSEDLPPLNTVSSVNISRYLGVWYEIARFPNSFQKNCNQATASYRLRDDEKLEILNTCVRSDDKKPKEATGLAKVVENSGNAKLKVNFVPGWLRWTGIGNGDYWIIDLDEGYAYAVVSEPNRKYLWILSRTPTMKKDTYEKILTFLKKEAFDTSKLIQSRENGVTQ